MASCSSTSVVKESYQYDVFLSFNGEDTRKNFVDHLYDALQQHGIHTFKDDERLTKGKNISDQLSKSIEDTKFFIIVFSKKYASSSWCLNELVRIMECQNSNEQIAYPVFYDVDPSDVRKQRGSVGEALALHTNQETGKWKKALSKAAILSGWDLRNTANGHEAKVIKLIVERISLELRATNVNLDDKLVGMESRLQDLKEYLDISSDDIRMIGIKGMGGAGKTTLAKASFDRLSRHFEAKSFVENVREVSKASLSGLLSLQKKILSDLLDGQGMNISSVHDGTNMIKTKLRGRRVLLVLDDVDHIGQLEALAGDLSWFKPGSRIIITTRDEQVLIAHRVIWIHDVNLLTDEEAIGLFSRHAFGKDVPFPEYESQSRQVVSYAAGLPLTIKVLGSFLCGKDKLEWIDALARLRTIPLKETLEKLELSYESLEDDYKEMFLDVACLLKGWEKEDAIRMLESCGFHARNGSRVLEQRSLITFNNDYYLKVFLTMHDHIEEMGKNIVRRLHPDDPNKHSRLWIQDEIEDVLSDNMGNEATMCISLKLTPQIVVEGLGNMRKLRCLIIKRNYKNCADLVNIDEVSQYFPNSLQYLNWHNLPQQSLPNSSIEQLWVGRKVLKKLKIMEFSDSKLRTLDLGLTPNLMRLDLRGCSDLVELNVPVGCLKRLVYLDLGSLQKLKSLSFIKDLESLEVLDLSGLRLKEFPDIIPNHSNSSSLQRLNFGLNDIQNLPSSIANLHNLVHLDLFGCHNLKSLQVSICSLQHLKALNLNRCWLIKELPEDIGQVECLEKLDLSYSKVKYLPDSICMLKHLKTLLLLECKVLDKLPKDIGQLDCLEELDLRHSKVKYLPDSICMLKHLKTLRLEECELLDKLPEDIGQLESLEELDLSCCKISDIPSSICKLKHLKILNLKGCGVRKLPEDFGQIESLIKLCLRSSEIREIPSSICKLKHLEEVDLSGCSELEKLPENIGDLKCLRKLNLWYTYISHLPRSISLLKGLRIDGAEGRIDPDAPLIKVECRRDPLQHIQL